jgi:calcineurin-like phosphoesterase family protein
MPNIFIVSDNHFGHSNILKFTKKDGSRLRDFATIEEMDQHIIDCHNSVVKESDTVYFLGDVTCSSKVDPLKNLYALRGRKILIKGNHDWHPLEEYSKFFEDIRACHELSGMVLTHIPLHPASMSRWGANIHGHLHDSVVTLENGQPDSRYFCASMERINYTPISLEEIKKHVSVPTTTGRPRRSDLKNLGLIS